MFIDYYKKNVSVTLVNGKVFKGFFMEATSELDNDGVATITIRDKNNKLWELEEREITKMELLKDTK